MGNHTPGPWQWEYNPSSKSVSLVGGKPMFDKTVMDFARWGMNRATPMFNEAITDPHGWHIITRLCDRPDWLAPIPGREHHKDWCMQVTHPDAMLMARAPELLKENERLRAEVEALKAENARLHTANERMRAALERVRCRDWTPDWVRDIANRALEGGE